MKNTDQILYLLNVHIHPSGHRRTLNLARPLLSLVLHFLGSTFELSSSTHADHVPLKATQGVYLTASCQQNSK